MAKHFMRALVGDSERKDKKRADPKQSPQAGEKRERAQISLFTK